MQIRKLKAEEIDVRVSTISGKGCSLLLYKDARVDQNILDETFGSMNWKRSHQLIGENLYCTVEIYDSEKGEWIAKQDVGTESLTEKEKGKASDSFKRACFNVGIGRELYTAPFIWINAGNVNIVDGENGKKKTFDHFYVDSINYDEGKISALVIRNRDKGNAVVYRYGKDSSEVISKNEQEVLRKLCEKAGLSVEETFPNGLDLTSEQYTEAHRKLNALLKS